MTSPVDAALARLDDYVRGQDGDDAVAAYEEKLFTRALEGAAPELQFRRDLGRALRELAARGTIDLWLTSSGVERVMASGLRVLRYDVDLDRFTPPDLSSEFDILITKVPFDLTGIRRLDAEVLAPTGERLKLMPDITFDPADGAVFACCEAGLARTAAAFQTVTRVWAVGDEGRRLLCEIKSG